MSRTAARCFNGLHPLDMFPTTWVFLRVYKGKGRNLIILIFRVAATLSDNLWAKIPSKDYGYIVMQIRRTRLRRSGAQTKHQIFSNSSTSLFWPPCLWLRLGLGPIKIKERARSAKWLVRDRKILQVSVSFLSDFMTCASNPFRRHHSDWSFLLCSSSEIKFRDSRSCYLPIRILEYVIFGNHLEFTHLPPISAGLFKLFSIIGLEPAPACQEPVARRQRFQVQNFSQIFFFLNPFVFVFLILFLDQLVSINYTPATVGV